MILLSNIIKAEYVLFENKKIVEKKAHNDCNSKENLYEIYTQREIIIKQAKDEALKIINTARKSAQTEISDCKKRGYDEGYNAGLEVGKNKGYEEGCEAGKKEIKTFLNKAKLELDVENENKVEEMKFMLEMIEKEKQNIISKYENDIGKLSIDIAEKLIKQKLDLNDNIISNIIKSAVKEFKNVEWVKIYISDKDEAKKIEADKFLISELQNVSKDVKIEVANELDEGSCIIETPDNIIDTGINTQLNNLKEMLMSK